MPPRSNSQTGFTALTGETGAGKSILIDALALALGERAGRDAGAGHRGPGRSHRGIFDRGHSRLRTWIEVQALEGDADRLLLRRIVERGGRTARFR